MKRFCLIAAIALMAPMAALSQNVAPQRQIDQLNALSRILKQQRDEAMDRAAVLASTVELLQGDIKAIQDAAARAAAPPPPALPAPPPPQAAAPLSPAAAPASPPEEEE